MSAPDAGAALAAPGAGAPAGAGWSCSSAAVRAELQAVSASDASVNGTATDRQSRATRGSGRRTRGGRIGVLGRGVSRALALVTARDERGGRSGAGRARRN